MSNIVTCEQAKKLKELGFEEETSKEYRTPVVRIFEGGKAKFVEREPDVYDTGKHASFYGDVSYDNYIPAPFIHEALDWIREEKGIDCCAFFNNELFGNLDNAKAIYYFKYGCNGRMIYNSWNVDYKSFDTHFLAESALLDAVLTYLEKK